MAGESSQTVHENLAKAKTIFEAVGYPAGMLDHKMISADLILREGDGLAAKETFLQCFDLARGKNTEGVIYCLERLGDVTRWSLADVDRTSTLAMVFLGFGMKLQNKRAICKAIQYLGDICFVRDDEDTAATLFTVALQGFTEMDIHQSKGDCMFRLGNLAEKKGQSQSAEEFWRAARPMFERSLQTNHVSQIDAKLAGTYGRVGRAE
ncbi:hypothetical protein FB451DRAFT_1285399 [Mycena latifolia]|nr:hypothetical protein FB451DRAFT_1285399 [Mycena latifolia]